MKVWREVSLRDFDFWAGAADHVRCLSDDDLIRIEVILRLEYPEGISTTELNDIFWHDAKTIALWLGHGSFQEIEERGNAK